MAVQSKRFIPKQVPKIRTGIAGLDEITQGGLPKAKATLIAGGAGSGKTLLASEIAIAGVKQFGEPAVIVTFEETAEDLAQNLAPLGHDLPALIAEGKLYVDYVYIERSEIEETGQYDLEGLFIRLGHAIDSVKAKRVVLDTIEVLFAGLDNMGVVRSELRRLFRWFKERGVSVFITAETGDGTLTRHGLEEYVADCVIMLDHRVNEQISTRRIRVVKYRGSSHGTNEYPFLLDRNGISVLPITSIGLEHVASTERVSSGIQGLDAMLGNKGFFRGSSVLVTGTAGTGKSSFAAHFAEAAAKRGERALYFAYEESESQIVRNMKSVGLNLAPQIKRGLLRIEAQRPTSTGLENHLAGMQRMVTEFAPSVVVMDPITNLINTGDIGSVKMMLTRMIDFLKVNNVTGMFTNLTQDANDQTAIGISSLMDTWINLRDIEQGETRVRGIYILKSRGMDHSKHVHSFTLTDRGISITSGMKAAHAD